MKAGADLEQRAHTSPDFRAAGRRPGDARENLEQRALARAIAADDSDDLPGGHREREAAEGPEMPLAVVLAASAEWGCHRADCRGR